MIVGKGVHAEDRLEEAGVAVVGYLHGHVVLVGWVFQFIEDLLLVEPLAEFVSLVSQRPANHEADGSVGDAFVRKFHLLELYLALSQGFAFLKLVAIIACKPANRVVVLLESFLSLGCFLAVGIERTCGQL